MWGITKVSSGRRCREGDLAEIAKDSEVVATIVLSTVSFGTDDVTEVEVIVGEVEDVDGLAGSGYDGDVVGFRGDEAFRDLGDV